MEIENLWDFFDEIRCINLSSREDRYEKAKKVFASIDIPVSFHRVEKHPNGGLQGCFESHVEIIRNAYESGAENVLIFEDDLTITNNFDEKLLKNAIDFMKNNTTWDLFYLGPFPEIRKYKTEKTSYKNIYKIHSLCGHAYVVNRKFMKKFKDAKFTGVPLDYIYVCNENSYAVYPGLFAQGGSKSDLDGNIMFNLDTLPHVKKAYFRGIEMYGQWINMPLKQLVVILLIIWFIIVILTPGKIYLHSAIFIIILLILFVA